ncbi:hypothetical protein BG004_005159 [Podila humilis]|nr:hypothetical protein BG004_005159 [Podila humilis]
MSPAPSSGRMAGNTMANGIPNPIYPTPSAPVHVQQQQPQSVYDLYDHHHNTTSMNYHSHQFNYDARAAAPGSPALGALTSTGHSTPAAWSDSNWRSIFDAALVKAQQAVQLDELKETTLAANLYAQAANDLGRVIPMCGSEKKKQSMLAIQAIYLDRVIQLKAAAKAAGQTAPAVDIHFGSSPHEYDLQYDDEQDSYQYQPQQYQTQPIPLQYQQLQQLPQHQQEQQQQTIFLQSTDMSFSATGTGTVQAPAKEDEPEKGFRLFGKKRSKTQPSTPHPPDLTAPTAQQQYEANFGSGNGFMPYGDSADNTASNNTALFTPSSQTSTPSVLVSPIFMTHSPYTPLPLHSNTNENTNEPPLAKKSSKWKPFGKKKSKSFSSGGGNDLSNHSSGGGNGAYQLPSDYHIPSIPLKHSNTSPFVAALPHQLVDPNERFMAFSEQDQHNSDWFVGIDEDDNDDDNDNYNGENQVMMASHFYDEDEDVDPYYIADTKGRARAFEGKDNGKKKEKEPSAVKEEPKASKSKPVLKHAASSYSNDQPFISTFSPDGIPRSGTSLQENPEEKPQQQQQQQQQQQHSTGDYLSSGHFSADRQTTLDDDWQLHPQANAGIYEQYEYEQTQYHDQNHEYDQEQQYALQQQQQQYYHLQEQHQAATNATPENSIGQDVEVEEKKSKRKWFGKKKKDGSGGVPEEKPADRLDEMARIMDEALFGGPSPVVTARKKKKEKEAKDKGKEKKTEPDMEEDIADEEGHNRPNSMMPLSSSSSFATTGAPMLPHYGQGKPAISPRKDSLTDYNGEVAKSVLQSLGTSSGSSQQQQQQQQQAQYHNTIYRQHSIESDLSSSQSYQPAVAPVSYTPLTSYKPKTTYTPSPKNPVKKPSLEEGVSMAKSLEPECAATNPQDDDEEEGSNVDPDDLLEEPAEVFMLETSSTHGHDAKSITSDSLKKSKSKNVFGDLFKSSKKGNKEHTDLASPPFSPTRLFHDDGRSVRSENTSKSSQMVASSSGSKKKDENDEYIPYEYQEEVEGPLMERVEVPENRDVIGFVMPVQELVDYSEGNEEAALDNWDSWVSQLESFEKVLSDKGMKKDKKKGKKEESLLGSLSSKGSRSSIFSTDRSSTFEFPGTAGDGQSSGGIQRPMSMAATSDANAQAVLQLNQQQYHQHRQSFHSTGSSGLIDTSAQQLSVQQAKKRWWNPKRKETTSVYSVSTTFSISDQDQEQQYLNSLLQSHDIAGTVRADDALTTTTPLNSKTLSMPGTPVSVSTMSSPSQTSEINVAALRSGREGSGGGSSAPSSIMEKTDETLSVKSLPVNESVAKVKTTPKQGAIPKEDNQPSEESGNEEPIAPMPKSKKPAAKAATAATTKPKKSSKPKLLPISTPLAQLLTLSNADELWQYVQQAKTYATTRMNKGDKRSAAIALKRAQALEARWQEVLLEMASSEEENDELLSDDDFDDDEEEEESEEDEECEVEVVVKKSKRKVIAAVAPEAPVKVVSKAAKTESKKKGKKRETKAEVEDDNEEEETMRTPVPANVAAPVAPIILHTQSVSSTATTSMTSTQEHRMEPEEEDDEEEQDEDSEVDADEERKALSRKTIISRRDNLPDKYSKYKVINKPSVNNSSSNQQQPLAVLTEEESNISDNGDGVVVVASRLGPDATLEEMLQSDQVEDLMFYIQRLKTATVAKARLGDKMAALEGMKNVKVLQQRLEELEEGDDGEKDDEKDEKEEKGKKEEEEEEEEHEEKKVKTKNDGVEVELTISTKD